MVADGDMVNGANSKILYFAYGSNMLSRRLRALDRAPSAVVVGIGFVVGRRFTLDKVSVGGSGKCDMEATDDGNDRVYGVLFEIDGAEKPSLDRAEGRGRGYREERVGVVTDSGSREAVTYIATSKEPALRPYHWYKALVVAGAREHGFQMPMWSGCELSILRQTRTRSVAPKTSMCCLAAKS